MDLIQIEDSLTLARVIANNNCDFCQSFYTYIIATVVETENILTVFMRIDIDLKQIEDRPAFPHRGVMLDTARNFIPTSNIKEVKKQHNFQNQPAQ